MPMPHAELERRLHEAFPDAEITVTDLAGDGDHYRARIVSPSFAGQSRVRQHQMVNRALGRRLGWNLARPGPRNPCPRKPWRRPLDKRRASP